MLTCASECPDNPALGKSVDVDFTKGPNDLFKEFDGTKLEYNENGAVFTINKETDAPTIGSTKYIFFGRVDVTVQASFGQGVVTSFVLQSDNLDEVDWEWLGGDFEQVQSNYFGKGDTTTYDRGAYHNVANPQTSTHTYSLDWTKESIKWIIDGNTVRELKYADAQGGSRYPQTPMQLRLGTWVAGRKDAPEGTVEWAGGYTDFSKAPFIAYYKDIKITDYSNGVKGATSYSWKEGSDGSYQSINVLTDGENNDETTSSSAKPTSTKTEDKKTESTATATKSEQKTESTATATKSAEKSDSTASATASGTASEAPAPTTTEGSGEGSGSGSGSGESGESNESGSDAPPAESEIPQSGAFKVGTSAVAACAGLFFGLML